MRPSESPLPADGEDPDLNACLALSRDQGFLGPMPIAAQIRHACAMASAVGDAPRRAVDLGSGGGVPGLVLACLRWPETQWQFIEANARRVAFLKEAVAQLGLQARVAIWHGRAEEAGRDRTLRHSVDLVVARSFGAPAVTAECAAPFLRADGAVLVSEPPGDRATPRWPSAGLAQLHLRLEAAQAEPVHVVLLRSTGACSDRYPRRVGIPAKRPLF